MPILEGKIYYSFVNPNKPDSYKGKEFWKVTLVPTPESLKKAKEMGLKLKGPSDKIPGQNITFKRNVVTRSGVNAEPVAVFDAKKNPWPKTMIIGNGSDAKVKFSLIELSDGPVTYLEKIQILNLVEFGNEDDDFDEEDGVDMSSYESENDKEDFENAVKNGANEESDPDFD